MIPAWQHPSPTRARGAWPVWVALAALWASHALGAPMHDRNHHIGLAGGGPDAR